MADNWLVYMLIVSILTLLILCVILVIVLVRRLSTQKKMIDAFEEKGYFLEKKEKEQEKFKEKKIIDELLFFLGAIAFVFGFLKNKLVFIFSGLVVMFLSLSLYRYLIKHKPRLEKREKTKRETIEEKPVIVIEKDIDENIKKVLKVVDDLLEKLPEEEIEKFSKSKDFELYKNVMERVK